MGGRVAEEMTFGRENVTSGATGDIQQATKMAKAMVTRFGMSDVIGPLQLNSGEANPFMGMELGEQRTYSEDVARKVDREVRRIIEAGYARAREVLTTHQAKLVLIAETLLQKEVMDRQEFLTLFRGQAEPTVAAGD
jgi:cell division protease FtsH